MPQETSQTAEVDLEKTDRLPALEMAGFDPEFADDAVPLEYPAGGPVASRGLLQSADFARPSSLDLPSLAETVRSVEERIARQNAEHEALRRAHEKALEAESAAVVRANDLAAELAAMRMALETEQLRARDFERALDERAANIQASQARADDALREADRLRDETRALTESLAARDAHITQVLHSLGERDAQLVSLQTEHARILPELEERYRTGSQLESDLQAARARAASLDQELNGTKSTVLGLTDQMKRREAELSGARTELEALKARSVSYLESLRTRDWRQGYHLNAIRELEGEVESAQSKIGALQAERDGLRGQLDQLNVELDARRHTIVELHGQVDAHGASLLAKDAELRAQEQDHAAALAAKEAELASQQRTHAAELVAKDSELALRDQAHADLSVTLAALDAERQRLTEVVAAREADIEAALATGSDETRRLSGLLESEMQKGQDQAQQILHLQSESEVLRRDMEALTAQLREARRPTEVIEAEVQRLTADLAAVTARGAELEGENAKLRSSLERTRGALEEREFLIRRLERSESNNANVLGRIQTSIERLGVTPATAGRADPARADTGRSDILRVEITRPTDIPRPDTARSDITRVDIEWAAELVRIDGGKSVAHVLGKRTRVGRATGCELRVDSSSVSRHHALILVGPREILIEDLNSTNGVYINGRKASRQVLNDGDTLTIGEALFRVAAKQVPRRESP